MSLEQILIKVNLFESDFDKDNSRRRLLWILEAMCQVNKLWLQLHPYPETPPLYESNVVYKVEKGEIFRDIPNIIKDGCGDCDCLACWRVAELQDIGIAARPYLKWRKEGPRWIYHALVWLPGEQIEDPSLALGMGGGKILRKPIYVAP
jgi:hypothetical protein